MSSFPQVHVLTRGNPWLPMRARWCRVSFVSWTDQCSTLTNWPLGDVTIIKKCNFLACFMDWYLNSLTPGRFQWNFRNIIFKLILVTDGCDISSKIALRWTSLDHSDDKSTLVQVMAWCHQATSHYLNQCWPRSLPPYWHHWAIMS